MLTSVLSWPGLCIVENVGYWKEVNLLHTQALGGRANSQICKTWNRSVPVEVLGLGSHLLWCNIDQQGGDVFLASLK